MSEPLVSNAASAQQVKDSKIKEKLGRDQELNDIRVVCSTKEGRRFLWRVLGRCKVFNSVWENSARIHYNSGQQDLGHFLMAEVIAADEQFLSQMMKENKKGES